MMTNAKNICPEKQQEFARVCQACDTVARRTEEVSSDIKGQLGVRVKEFDSFLLACDKSTDALDTAQLLIFLGEWITTGTSLKNVLTSRA